MAPPWGIQMWRAKCASIIGPRKLLIFFAFRAPIQETPKINILIPKKKKKKQES
jgi:hypothetical protein